MTGFNTYFSLSKVNVDIPYQKVIDYVNNFSHYRKTVSLICSLCLCVMIIPLDTKDMVCGDPESGTSRFKGGQCIHYLVQGCTHGASRVNAIMYYLCSSMYIYK